MSYAKAQAQYDEQPDIAAQKARMCIAHGCPNRWCVDGGNGRLCSAHAWADLNHWPVITQRQLWDETDRARANGEPPPSVYPLSADDKREILDTLRAVGAISPNGQRRAWALALKAREEFGERLSIAQRAMWRAALGPERVDEEPTP